MPLSAVFTWREEPTPELLELLGNTTHGTNGAVYRHLDTRTRIREMDRPLFLSLERNGKVSANVTFCRREGNWYIRYFAFAAHLQAGASGNKSAGSGSRLKKELETFFQQQLAGEVKSFYAYIDPNNARSVAMGQTFGLKPVGELATQTFSRAYPRRNPHLEQITDPQRVLEWGTREFGNHRYWIADHVVKPPFYALRDKQGEVIAFAKVTQANWKIVQLPGKNGPLLTKLVPYIPILRKFIRPSRHVFLVAEAVYVRNADPQILEQLFEGILHACGQNLLLWWTDVNEPLYKAVKSKTSWGLMHRILGVSPVQVVARTSGNTKIPKDIRPIFVTGIDLI
jgi:hypothetical protein